MLFPSGFDRTIALEAGALVMQAYAQFDQFAAKQPWNSQGPYDALGLLNAKPRSCSATGSSLAARCRGTCL